MELLREERTKRELVTCLSFGEKPCDWVVPF